MSRQQRLVFAAIAAVIAVLAIAVLSGGDDKEPATTSTAIATATPTLAAEETPAAAEPAETETPEPIATAEDEGPVLKLGAEETVSVKKGDTVRFTAESETADHVHVHGYDLKQDVKAGGSVDFSFEATITGIFEIELEEAGKTIGKLVVEP